MMGLVAYAVDLMADILVNGDNLRALKALLPYYRKQVKRIYIDPPYNTGNEGWAYNDNVNSLEINKRLGWAAGCEAAQIHRPIRARTFL